MSERSYPYFSNDLTLTTTISTPRHILLEKCTVRDQLT